MVKEFNAGNIGVLVCTSSLIKGASTAAQSVMIFDKANPSKYDFFDFATTSTLVAPAAQKRYVGKVFLFDQPPVGRETDQGFASLEDLGDPLDEVVVDLSSGRNPDPAVERGESLPVGHVRRFSALPAEAIAAVQKQVELAQTDGALPIWSGYPSYHDMLAVNEILCNALDPREHFGVASAQRLTHCMQQLRNCRTMKEFFAWYGSDAPDDHGYDQVFLFLRACESNLALYYELTQTLLNTVCHFRLDFSPFVSQMKTLFRPDPIITLEERGIPFQIAEKCYSPYDSADDLVARIKAAARSRTDVFNSFEQDWILASLS